MMANMFQTWFNIMKRALAKCCNINLKSMGEIMPSFLDSGSMINLIWQNYFNRYFIPWLGPVD